MTWGKMFGWVHLLTLLFAVAIIVGIYFILRNKSVKTKTITLGILSFAGIGAIIFNLVVWHSPLEYLPLHLCSLNALVLPFAVFSRNKFLNNLLLLWCFGAVFALLVISEGGGQSNFEILSWTFVFYYFPHVLEVGIPILMFTLKLVERDVKCILTSIAITILAYSIIHFINLGVNNYCTANNILDNSGNLIQVNYMYSISPENPLLSLFYSIIPYQYWYMMLSIPVVAIYLSILYIDKIIIALKTAKKRK